MTFPSPPTPPNSGDPANFNARADAFLAWMAQFANEINAAGYPSIPLSLPNGTVSAPALAFASQPNTGYYRPSTSVLALSVNGTERGRWTTSGLEVTGTIRGTGASNLPALVSAASDTGSISNTQLRAVLASSTSRADGTASATIASNGCRASANRTLAGASLDVVIDGATSVALAHETGIVSGSRSAGIANWRCDVLGGRAFVAGSLDSVCDTAAQGAVIASRATRNNVNGSLALGNGSSTSQADASTANRTIHLFGTTGNIQISGALTSGHTFADYGEMLPNGTGEEIPAGIILAMDGDEVRPAGPDDDIVGVVSHTMAVRAGDTPFFWQGRYLFDEFGRQVLGEILDPDWEAEIPDPEWQPLMLDVFDAEGMPIGQVEAPDQIAPMIPNPRGQHMLTVLVENPEWDPSLPQTPRSERPADWTPAGMLGQVFTRVAADVVPGDRLSAVDGIGVKSTARTGLRCMTITQPYDAAKGYAVARCLINIQV